MPGFVGRGRLLIAGILVVGLCALEFMYGRNVSESWKRDSSWMQSVEDVGSNSSATPQTIRNRIPGLDPISSRAASTTNGGTELSNHHDTRLQCNGDLTKNSAHYNNSMNKLTADQLDKTDTIFLRQGWDNDPFVIESHKLLFFTVPKNSCTEWKKLFKRMLNHPDWNSDRIDPVHNPSANRLKYLGHYSKEQQEELMTSPEWTRAIFLRDPFQRLLSAFLDKGHGWERYIQRLCCQGSRMRFMQDLSRQQCLVLNALQQNGTLPTPKEFPFENFVDGFMKQCSDSHWEPQSNRIKPKNWQWINFVGYFDNLENDARCLLERIGAWEAYGASGWGKDGTLSFFQRNTAVHSTSAQYLQDKFYTPDLLQKVWLYLKPDYEHPMFNFTKPDGID